MATWFKALSHPLRLRIFLDLAERCGPGGCRVSGVKEMRRCVGELSAALGVAPTTVSHHLKELRVAGLMRVERRGRWVDCWASDDAVRLLAGLFSGPAAIRPRAGDRRRKR